MTDRTLYGLLADLVLLVHFSYVAFVVLGLVYVCAGAWLRWSFVRNFYFRAAHLLAMGVVAAESIFGIVCPLTVWESDLRRLAGGGGRFAGGGEEYRESFMQHWIHRLMFFDLPPPVFTAIYIAFLAALVLSWILVRPRWPKWLARGRKTS